MTEAKTILIADNDAGNADATATLLYMAGYEVFSTPFGDSVPQLAKTLPHLIILDVFLGETDGRNICKILKEDPLTKDIPVLMLSAHKEFEFSVREAGADYFIEKPFATEVLLKKIDELLLKNTKTPGRSAIDWFGMLRASVY